MKTALILLGVLATTWALLDGGYNKVPRNEANFIVQDGGYNKDPRNEADYNKKLHIPQFKLPAFTPKNVIECSKKRQKKFLAPGETANFQSPNFPLNYGARNKCKWIFKSTEDITISCSAFSLHPANESGKCFDRLKIGFGKYCGNDTPFYEGGKRVKVVFKSNKKKQASGFLCMASAKSNTSITTTTNPSSSCTCGQANRGTRIVGGVETEENEYPWQAGLVYYDTSSVFCGGSVIGSKHILTSAYCTQTIAHYGMSYQVLVGAHSLTNPASSQLRLDANAYNQHIDFDDFTFENDIAIIELSEEISFTNSDVRPVCLPANDADDYASVNAIVSGWGRLEFEGEQPDVLMEVTVPTMTNAECNTYYHGGITNNMLCAGYAAGGKDSCLGDDGGPLITAGSSGSCYTQIGVVSALVGCYGAGYPTLYARVTKYLSWISSNTASSETCSPC